MDFEPGEYIVWREVVPGTPPLEVDVEFIRVSDDGRYVGVIETETGSEWWFSYQEASRFLQRN